MVRLQKPCLTIARRLIFLVTAVAFIILVLQTCLLPSRIAFSPLFPALKIHGISKFDSPGDPTRSSLRVGKFSLLSDSRNSTSPSLIVSDVTTSQISDTRKQASHDVRTKKMNAETNQDDSLSVDEDEDDTDTGDEDPDTEFSFDLGNGVILKKVRDPIDGFIQLERFMDSKYIASEKKVGEPAASTPSLSDSISELNHFSVSHRVGASVDELSSSPVASIPEDSLSNNKLSSSSVASFPEDSLSIDVPIDPTRAIRANNILSVEQNLSVVPSSEKQSEMPMGQDTMLTFQNRTITSNNKYTSINTSLRKKKKRVMPPVSMSEMNYLLLRNRAAYRSMRPRWSSSHDQKMLAARALIENAPPVKNDKELHEPAFRNISMFKRSYEIMEGMLKVYVYKEGAKPIFHQPLLKGIYASEGWFMKLMESSRHFLVKNPRKANMFYMPFSSRLLEFALYVPNSHNRTKLKQFLNNYVNMLASKYPFWNRTGGADHFLAACHDWGPYETRHSMEQSIRALCNSDVRDGFRLGKDVSLLQSYVRSAKDPLRDLGGRPAGKRTYLAFFAGNMHGSLRPIILQHWENKDPDMKIFGPMPPGVKSKMSYIQYMKKSKYCICPRGYEVNSPRVVESIFYECVPVIISDNFVPPFFEVLNWDAFSVIIPEEDVPRLKEILLSIPRERYFAMQKGVRKVQHHFLWHSKPVKYDAFHMVLHSIWFNRVFNVRTR